MAANNAQKTPFTRTINEFALRKATDAIQLLGKALPASVVSVTNSIVTVNFELNTTFTLPQVTVPIATSQYRREPTQVGDLGVVRPADVHLGGITGLGGGTADLTVPANLSALVWEPVANQNWSATDDANAYLIYGPNGAIIRDTGKNCIVTLDQTQITLSGKNEVTIKVGNSVSVILTSSQVQINGTLVINGQQYLQHLHTGVTAGSSDTGPVA